MNALQLPTNTCTNLRNKMLSEPNILQKILKSKMQKPVNTEEYCLNDRMISRQFKILATPLEEARG